ncbi:MAG: putative toxin [Anaerolineaceae bacterium]|nr:putative toxin [Anaerolineaceae bacterium]
MNRWITIFVVMTLAVTSTTPVSAHSARTENADSSPSARPLAQVGGWWLISVSQSLIQEFQSWLPAAGFGAPIRRTLAYTCSAGFVETGNYEWNHSSVNLSGANSLGTMYGGGDTYTVWKGTIQFAYSGDAVKIVYHYFWRPGGFTVTIDGTGYGTVTTTANGEDETVVRYWQGPTLTRGSHNVVLTYIAPFHSTWSGYKTLNCNDATPPSISVSLTPSGWTNQSVTARSTASDPGSGVAHNYCRLNNEGWMDAGAGTCTRTAPTQNTFYYYAVDRLGNTSGVGSVPINIETIPPTISPSKSPASTWANQNVIATASTSDAGGSGVAHTYCKLSSEISWVDSGTAACQRTATATSTFQYYAIDVAGNASGSAASPLTLPINIEKVAPVASATKSPADEWSGPSVDVAATAIDSGGSGVAHLYCRLQGEASYTDSGTSPCARVGITTLSYFQYYAVDHAGNSHGSAASPLVLPVRQDNTPPSVQVFLPPTPGLIYTASWMGTDGQTTIRDYSVKYLDQTETWQYPLTNSHELQLELFGNSGTNTNQVCVRSTDANGNQSAWVCSSLFSVTAEERSYYSFRGNVVAMRTNGAAEQYLAADQVSSMSLVTSGTGALVSQTRYTPYGQVRWTNQGNLNTDKRYTGQRDDGMGLLDYNARYYDVALNRWAQPDTIVPERTQGVQAWDRYAYANYSPVNYNDPSGHCLILCTAIIGSAVGAMVGAIGYSAYTAATGREFNAGQMFLATGGGAAAGALLGTGIGIAAGMSTAAATTAAVTGAGAATTATTAVMKATGGDPTDEIQAATQVAQQTFPSVAQTLGQTGESLAGVVKNTTHIPSLTETAAFRIPDQLVRSQNLLSEVKNVAYQAYTNQIKDYLLYTQQQGLKFELIVRQNTEFSKPLQTLIDAGKIIPQRYLPAR